MIVHTVAMPTTASSIQSLIGGDKWMGTTLLLQASGTFYFGTDQFFTGEANVIYSIPIVNLAEFKVYGSSGDTLKVGLC